MHFIFKKHYIFIGGSLLILGAAIYAAQWKWHFWHTAQNSPSAPSVMANSMDDAMGNEQNEEFANPDNNSIREVLSANLFGAEGVAKTASAEAVPKTAQPLELRGIVFIPHHPEQSVALVAQVGQPAKDYKKGDKVLPDVMPDVTVVEISPDVVFIENQGVREKLVLPKFDYSQTGNQQPAISPANQFENTQIQEGMDPAAENVELLPQDNMQPPQGNDPQPMPNDSPSPPNAQPLDNVQPPPESPVESPLNNPVE